MTSKDAAIIFKNDYLSCLELIKENYRENDPSRLKPSIFYQKCIVFEKKIGRASCRERVLAIV